MGADRASKTNKHGAATPKESFTRSTTIDFFCRLRIKQYTSTESTKNPGSRRVILL